MLGVLFTRARWLVWTGFYRALGRIVLGRIGSGCWFEGWVDLPAYGGDIELGNRVRVCRGVEWTVLRGARLSIRDSAFIGRGVVISAHSSVEIGERSLVGEYVCIHDNDHVSAPASEKANPKFASSPIAVAEDCWLGAHAVMVRGSGMAGRCVLGAGAVLTRPLEAGSVAVGVPARVVKTR